jgi:hypothetical protein
MVRYEVLKGGFENHRLFSGLPVEWAILRCDMMAPEGRLVIRPASVGVVEDASQAVNSAVSAGACSQRTSGAAGKGGA